LRRWSTARANWRHEYVVVRLSGEGPDALPAFAVDRAVRGFAIGLALLSAALFALAPSLRTTR
jgi:hypothetical protein